MEIPALEGDEAVVAVLLQEGTHSMMHWCVTGRERHEDEVRVCTALWEWSSNVLEESKPMPQREDWQVADTVTT